MATLDLLGNIRISSFPGSIPPSSPRLSVYLLVTPRRLLYSRTWHYHPYHSSTSCVSVWGNRPSSLPFRLHFPQAPTPPAPRPGATARVDTGSEVAHACLRTRLSISRRGQPEAAAKVLMMRSPVLSAVPAWRNRVPTQVRRCIPMYIAFICFVLILLNADLFRTTSTATPKSFTKRHTAKGGSAKDQGALFPRKIWQTWKVDPLSFDQRDSITARTWTTKNKDYRYEVLTDDNDMTWIEYNYGPQNLDRPDIVEFYRTVNATIIKADLLRYLVMYAEGGVYADIDVEDLKPVRRWISDRFNEEDIDMVIGVEIDEPEFKDHPILGKKSQSFCQWTFMAKPRLPVMIQLVENIMAWLNGIAAQQGVDLSEVQLDFDEVISGTGPSAFTLAILGDMNRVAGGGKKITWDRFHDMDESRLVSRVLVLDVEAYAAGQGHSDSGNHNARGALVKHHYHASNWPSRHPRFRHPVFGEVERCNWDAACVRKWDADVEAFKSLSPDEQQERIRQAQEPAVLPEVPQQQVPFAFGQGASGAVPEAPLAPAPPPPAFPVGL